MAKKASKKKHGMKKKSAAAHAKPAEKKAPKVVNRSKMVCEFC